MKKSVLYSLYLIILKIVFVFYLKYDFKIYMLRKKKKKNLTERIIFFIYVKVSTLQAAEILYIKMRRFSCIYDEKKKGISYLIFLFYKIELVFIYHGTNRNLPLQNFFVLAS